MIAASKLDRRIRIERAVTIDDGMQTRPGNWTTIGNRWAAYLPGPGREAREALGRDGLQSVRFRVRWDVVTATISVGDRIRYPANATGQIFDIKGVMQIGRREELEFVAQVALEAGHGA